MQSSGGSTLRSRRRAGGHDSRSSGRAGKVNSSLSAMAALSVKERIARKSKKPIIQGRQFKWISPAERMRAMSVDMGRVRERREMLEGDEEGVDGKGPVDTHSLFGHTLAASAQLNLSLPFIAFKRMIEPKTRSLPLVIHHCEAIVHAICFSLGGSSHDVELCGEAILDLIPPLVTDLSTLLLPYLSALLTSLILLTEPRPLTLANPKLLERVYDALGVIFRDLGKDVIAVENPGQKGSLEEVWNVVRRGLGGKAHMDAPFAEDVPEVLVTIDGDDSSPLQSSQKENMGEDDESAHDEEQEETENALPVASTSVSISVDPLQALGMTRKNKSKGPTIPIDFPTTSQTRRLLASAFSFLVRKARPSSKSSIAKDIAGSEPVDLKAGELQRLMTLMINDVAGLKEACNVEPSQFLATQATASRGKGKSHENDRSGGSSVHLAEGVVWVIVETCHTPDGLLHSRSAAVLKILLSTVLEKEVGAESLPSAIVGHTLTAIANHVRDAEIFQPLVAEVVNAARYLLQDRGAIKDQSPEHLGVVLKALEVVLGVKNGQKVTTLNRSSILALLSPLLEHILQTPANVQKQLLGIYTTLVVGAATQVSLQDVFSGGLHQAINVLFSPSVNMQKFVTACGLASTLDFLAWPHFSAAFALSIVESTTRCLTVEQMEKSSESTLSSQGLEETSMTLLARLAYSGRLREMRISSSAHFARWQSAISEVCQKHLKQSISEFNEGRTLSSGKTFELLDALLVVPHLPAACTAMLPLVMELVVAITKSNEDPRTTFLGSAACPAVILAAALDSVSRMLSTEAASFGEDIQKLRKCTIMMIERFSWHRGVMEGIATLRLAEEAGLSYVAGQTSIHDSILTNILSEDSLLRLSSLRIAKSLFPCTTPVSVDLILKCIEVEEMPLSVQGAREKSMKIRKIGILASGRLDRSDGEDTSLILEILLRYLTAMLKVNFKPLWPEAIQAIVLLSQRFPDHVWRICSHQLIVVATLDSSLYVSRKPTWSHATQAASPYNVFEEPKFRCHHLDELRQIVSQERNFFGTEESNWHAREVTLIPLQISSERLVVQTYEAQLIALFCEIPDLAQKHSRDLTGIYLACFRKANNLQSHEDNSARTYDRPNETSKERILRLVAWLNLFAKFTNPKSLYRSSELKEHFLELLAFPDADVQKIALECLLRWKTPSLSANAERLRNLMDPAKLRDELLYFVSTTDSGGLDVVHRVEVVPLMIRIAYGLMTSRLGRASASSGQGRAGRRAAILGALKTCSSSELDVLVDLTLGPLRNNISRTDGKMLFQLTEHRPDISGKRQLGFLGFLGDILKHLGRDLLHRWPDLIGATLTLLHFAQKGIEEEEGANMQDGTMSDEDEDIDEEAIGFENSDIRAAPLRSIRQNAIKRLTDFFRQEASFDFSPYLCVAFPSFISPRLSSFASENAQSPSAMLELFTTWSVRRDLAHNFIQYDATLLPMLYGILTVRNVKAVVILRVFDIVSSLLELSAEDGGRDSPIGKEIILPSVQVLLSQLAALFGMNAAMIDSRHEVGQRQISLLCSLAPYVQSSEQAVDFIGLLLPMLRKANKIVMEKIKSDLLRIFTALYPIAQPPPETALHQRCYDTVSSLFASLRTRNGRLQLVAAFGTMAATEATYQPISDMIEELNCFSVKRSEEPDFDRRLAAYSSLNEDIHKTLKATEWIVVVQNMLFFIQDAEELAIRSNASFSLRRFIEVSGSSQEEDLRSIIVKILLPGLRRTLHSKLEIVRSEALGVYAYAVDRCSGVEELNQLKCLLVGGDAEANFFNNILHIQIHRRTRALRRLADEAEAGKISSKLLSEIMIPVLDSFILGSDEKKDPELVNETVQCYGRLAKQLSWSHYNKLVQQYLRHAKLTGQSQKASVRTLVALLKGFHFDLAENSRQFETTTGKLLPDLLSYLEERDKTAEEIRIPIAEGISAVVQHLPPDAKNAQEISLLTALAQILRSQDQHTRDLTRVTLCNITSAVGTDVLPAIVKELRRALARGPQLHVLAFTVHAILVKAAIDPESVDFDGSLEELMPVLADDVFGHPAKDRESPEFRAKTKFREVKSFKSLDSFQLLARTVSPHKISAILTPVRDVMQKSDSAKFMKSVDEVLRHVTLGLSSNRRLESVALLDLAQSLIGQNALFLRPARTIQKGRRAAKDYHVQLTQHEVEDQDLYSMNAHHFVLFGLDLFNTAFRKSYFDLDSPTVIARLEPLVNVVGNTLLSSEPAVLAQGMRATASLIRCPLVSVGKAAPVLVKQMLAIINRSGSTESDLAQSTLRTLAIVIRDCKSVMLSEEQLTQLLLLIGPDLEEADKQATLFQLLRAIMARKFVAPEIYDLMDKVAEILVTNQTNNIREISRAIYLQFLLDYPQGRGRLNKSLAFLAKNLTFVHESGRLSVLELINAILSKFASQLIQESANLFFMGLVMVMANDESTKCREMAAALIALLVTRIEKETRGTFFEVLQAWAGSFDQPQLARTSVQLFGVITQALGEEGRSLAPRILEILRKILVESAKLVEEAEENASDLIDLEARWQLAYQALQSLTHFQRMYADLVDESDAVLWSAVSGHLLFPHMWVRTAAARLLGSLYASSSLSIGDKDLPKDSPLSTGNLLDSAQKGCLQLKSPLLSEAQATQIVKNLFFAAKSFDARREYSTAALQVDEEEDDKAEEELTKSPAGDPLKWIFTRLSYQIRAAHIARPSVHAVKAGQWSLQPASILRWFAAVIMLLDARTVSQFLFQIASPIFRIIEDPNAQDPQMADLQDLAREVQELIQGKIGVTAYSDVHTQIRQKAAERKNTRKTLLAVQALNDPAEEAKRKAKRNEQKARQKKRKVAAFADSKIRFGIGHSKKRRE